MLFAELNYITRMKKITDISTSELIGLANDAWAVAAHKALADGLSVTGSRDGRRIRYYPDGRIEDLGPVSDLPPNEAEVKNHKSGRSVA